MLVSDVIAEVRQLINETDQTNTHVTNAELLAWINACTLHLLESLGTYPYVSTTAVATASDITLDAKYLAIEGVFLADTNGQHVKLESIDFVNFLRYNPAFMDAEAGVPRYFVRKTESDWFLFPAPDSTYLGQTITIYAKTLPTPLTAETDTLPFSIALHPAYTYYVSWKAFDGPMQQPTKAAVAFQQFDTLRMKAQGLATSTMSNRKGFHWR